MNAASRPRAASSQRLLVVDPQADDAAIVAASTLPAFFRAGDVLVVNDAATLPASLHGVVVGDVTGGDVEARLFAPPRDGRVRVALFGAGDWRTPTEQRPLAPSLAPGARLAFAGGLGAVVVEAAHDRRSATLQFDRDGAALTAALYRAARPVQYSYLDDDVALDDVQVSFGGRPWAVEMPSAARPITIEALLAFARKGVDVLALTHGAGLSSIGDDDADRVLPLPERYDVPAATVARIERARATGGRVIAIGTTVVRALEGAHREGGGRLRPGHGTTDLVIGAGTELRVVDGVVSGVHDLGTSHHRLLEAFGVPDLLGRATRRAETAGLLVHEFGDATLVLPGALASLPATIVRQPLARGAPILVDSAGTPPAPR